MATTKTLRDLERKRLFAENEYLREKLGDAITLLRQVDEEQRHHSHTLVKQVAEFLAEADRA